MTCSINPSASALEKRGGPSSSSKSEIWGRGGENGLYMYVSLCKMLYF